MLCRLNTIVPLLVIFGGISIAHALDPKMTFDQYLEGNREAQKKQGLRNLERMANNFEQAIAEDPSIIELSEKLLETLKKKHIEVENFKLGAVSHTYATQAASIESYRIALQESLTALKTIPRRQEKLRIENLELVPGKNFQKTYDSYIVTTPINPLHWIALASHKGIDDERYQAHLRQVKAETLEKILPYSRMFSSEEKAKIITESMTICRRPDMHQEKNSLIRYLSFDKGKVGREVYIAKLKKPHDDSGTVSLILNLDDQCRLISAKVHNYRKNSLVDMSEWDGVGERKSYLQFAKNSQAAELCDEQEEESSAWDSFKQLFQELISKP